LPSAAEIADPLPIAGLDPAANGLVIGTVAGLRAIKNLPRLVRIFAAGAPADARLVIMGEGPERAAIVAEADRLGVAGRLILPGFVRDPVRHMGAFDIFALSSDSEQFPISLVEAMACGLPALCTDVGDIASMAGPLNLPFILPRNNEAGLADALASLCADPTLRSAIGAENHQLAQTEFAEEAMLAHYRAVYGAAIARTGGPKMALD
jgi:glycosyltransferase involved in cell wall biosynthesis